MSHLRGTDRSEVQMLPPCLDDYVAAEAAVRCIDAYARSLDFKALELWALRNQGHPDDRLITP
ncbi:hypothetical protein [Prosthecobacter sp.]|uniref:hypothetical protein n=1 Tax=Prosthecobacter sp. TaxID=1965333 RepID=UPI0037842AC7